MGLLQINLNEVIQFLFSQQIVFQYIFIQFKIQIMHNKQNSVSRLECRKIDNSMNLNVNTRVQKINQNLRHLICLKQQSDQPSQQIDFKEILKKGSNSSNKYLPYKKTSKQKIVIKEKKNNPTALNINNKQNKNLNAVSNQNNNQTIRLTKHKNTQNFKTVTINNKNKKQQSPGSSIDKKPKSLSKLDKKMRKSMTNIRKSFSPQRSYKLDKLKKQTSKPKTSRQNINTHRQNLSSNNANNKSVPNTDRLNTKKLHQVEESPIKDKFCVKKKTKKKLSNFQTKYNDQNKPILDGDSVYLAKQLHKISTNKNLKVKGNKKVSDKLKKGKKVILSQNLSKNREYSLKQNQNQNQILSHRYRNSYQPESKPLKTIKQKARIPKSQTSLKTEYSSPNPQRIMHQAARKIQKIIRGYLVRKRFKKIQKQKIQACIKIQKIIRGFLVRRRLNKMKINENMPRLINQQQQSLKTIKDFNQQNQSSGKSKKSLDLIIDTKQIHTRERIKKLLDNMDSSSQKSKLSTDKKMFESPKYSSHTPKQLDLPLRHRPQIKIQSPTALLQTLPNLQKLHKQKLFYNSNIQKQNLQRLLDQKLCSPKTYDLKVKQIQDRLKHQIQRFQLGVRQVVRGWNITNDDGLGFMTPQSQLKKTFILNLKSQDKQKKIQKQKQKQIQLNQVISEDWKQPSDKFDDLSIQLSQYIQQKQLDPNIEELKFDSSLLFIQGYLTNLLEFLQNSEQWKQQFLQTMKTPRSIQIGVLLKNLTCLTQESQQDYNFKLPLYKYLRYNVHKLIPQELIQKFHQIYKKLKRHSFQKPSASHLQQIHLKVVVQVLQQQLHKQRPIKPLMCFQPLKFTAKVHHSLINKDLQMQQLIFHNYFAYAFQGVYKCGSQLCGFIEDSRQIEQNYLNIVNQCRLTNMINNQIKQSQVQNLKHQEQEIEVLVALAEEVFFQIIFETIKQPLFKLS